MGDSIGMVLGLFREAFGTSRPLEGKVLFLNKIPGEDRNDEVIADGAVIAAIRFDLRKDRMVLDLRQAGAEMLEPYATKNTVRFGGMSGHLKGKTVPGSNIIEYTGRFEEGDPLILRKGQKVGPGTALASSDSLKEAERAVKIRDLNAPAEKHPIADADLDVFVEANRDHIVRISRRAVKEMKRFLGERNTKGLPVTVSFSGGKDSLVAYGLASRVAESPDLLYIDTGLEFPESTEYVRSFAEAHGNRIHVAHGNEGFWENVDTFGPPAKDFRWCCKVCKLGPMTETISRDFPKGTITVEGNRKLESFARSEIGLVTKNPFVPNQVNLNPIRDWCSAEVWGYILLFGLEYNPLYDRDFERIGCYLCPSCLTSEWRNTGRIHPELYSRWEGHLHSYAESRGLPPEYADLSFWRWKSLPPKMVQIADEMGIDLRPKSAAGPSMKMLKGASPCAAGGYSVEAIVTVPRTRDFSYTADALRTVGDTRYSDEYEIALLRLPVGRARLFGGGQVSVNAPDERNAKMVFEKAVKALIRAMMCTECGICAEGCPRKAIRIQGGMRVDPARCTSCGRCEKSCMVVHYYDKLMDSVPGSRPRNH